MNLVVPKLPKLKWFSFEIAKQNDFCSLTYDCFLLFKGLPEFAVHATQHAADLRDVAQGCCRSNLGTRNLFYYFLLRPDNFLTHQTTKNLNIARPQNRNLDIEQMSVLHFVLGKSVVHSVLSARQRACFKFSGDNKRTIGRPKVN